MGKILKYCSSCEEGFAERFTFCPVCGASLQTFEMNPVSGEVSSTTDASAPVPEVIENDFAVADMAASSDVEPEMPAFIAEAPAEPAVVPHFAAAPEEPAEVRQISATQQEPEPAEPEHIVEVTAAGSYFEPPATAAFSEPFVASKPYTYIPDEAFHVTVIEEKNSKQRNGLLLGSTVFIISLMLFATVYSLFAKDISIGSIGGDNNVAFLPVEVPDEVEPEKVEAKKKDNAGGGGGGGNEEETPASKGAPPPMMSKPLVAPDAHADRLTNPTIPLQVGVKGPDQNKIDVDRRYGLLNGSDNPSNGPGSGTGIGTGRGGGVGSGLDSGQGSGSGGGSGGGNGGGIGDGSGGGKDGPPDLVRAVSTPLKILSKPKAPYTDEARQNNVQGSVTVKVTFLASGQVGSVTAVTRLPYGLTEQAIAAAKQIRFEPKKINGVPVATTVTFQYGFNIY